jgi:hypothetical protein
MVMTVIYKASINGYPEINLKPKTPINNKKPSKKTAV